MSNNAAAAAIHSPDQARQAATLRFATGVTAAFVLCEWMQWIPTFMAPVLAAVLLANLPIRPPLKMGIGLVVVMTAAALYAFVLASLLGGFPTVLYGAIALTMFVTLFGMASGKPALPGLLLLLCVATIPVIVMIAPAYGALLPVAMVRGIVIALVAIWSVHALWPQLSATAKAAVPATVNPMPLESALLATLVVIPVMLVYLLYGLADALPVLAATVMLAATFDPRQGSKQALGMVVGNFAGGVFGLLLHTLLTLTPSLLFLAISLFLTLLWFGQRIAAGGPMAGVYLIACNGMLIILSSAIASGDGSLSIWMARLFQFALAGAFCVGMMTLLWNMPRREVCESPQNSPDLSPLHSQPNTSEETSR